MADYTLYYWPIPFRGQFVRAVLAWVGATWDEAGFEATAEMKDRAVGDQPAPAMAPPILTDHAAGLTLAQMPAILAYLGARHALVPDDLAKAALTLKILSDANDVLDEITRYGGRISMWDDDSWAAFRPRLARWMTIFEETGRRHGLTAAGGTLLGEARPGLADLVTCVLWSTMTDRLSDLRQVLHAEAPAVAALCGRMSATPALAALRTRTDEAYGDVYCGGQIEASLREVMARA